MNTLVPSPMMTVKLREATVALLMARRADDRETLDSVVARLAGIVQPVVPILSISPKPAPCPVAGPLRHNPGKEYGVVVLGKKFTAPTLGKMFSEVIDALAAIDTAAIERLAAMSARKRSFVARSRGAVHPGRPDLPTLETSSGWWVSANVGAADTERALRAMCKASDLVYGRDIIFLGKTDQKSLKA